MTILIEDQKIITKWQDKIKRGFLWITILRLYDEKAPLTGTDIKNRIKTRLHHNWDPSPGSIYPILKEMETDGLIIQDLDHAILDKKNKMYTITERGSDLLVSLRDEVFVFKMPPLEFLKRMGENEGEFKERFGSMCNNLSQNEVDEMHILIHKMLQWFDEVVNEKST